VSRWENKYVIGLTGNIAVGKSVVRQMLQHLGAYTIDADGLAHQAMSPGAPAYKPIIETFGQFILNPDKTINRKMLGNIVFSNKEALGKLEAITHPIISQAINTLVKRAKQRVVVIEAIKLLEGDLKGAVDGVWVVDAKPQNQYSRLINRRKMAEEDAKQRILAQNTQGEKLKQADVVINNDGNFEDTWKQVQTAWNKIGKSEPAGDTSGTSSTVSSTNAAQQTAQPATQAPQAQPATAQKPMASEADIAEGDDIAAIPAGSVPITVKRGMPSNADVIASFISEAKGEEVNRTDVLMSFGQKSYLLAEDESETTVAVVGWQVENLITRADELYIKQGAPTESIVYALVRAIEDASKELQSEVSFVFLPNTAGEDIVQPFLKSGYEATTVKEIKIPAWREAVQEVAQEGIQILNKKLRQDRVLKPI